MQQDSKTILIDKASLADVLDYLPYPFVLSEHRNGSEFTLCVNKRFTKEIGYSSEDIPSVKEWFEKAYPDPVYREEVMRDWQDKMNKVDRTDDGYVIRQAKIQTKNSGAKWYEVKASILGPVNFVAFINIDKEIMREQELEILNENKNRILSILSHDLRSPLNNLHVAVDLAVRELLTSTEQNDILKKIDHQVLQLLEFLDTTLHWARPNFAEVRSVHQRTDIKVIVDKLLSLYQYPIENKQLSITSALSPDMVILSDPELVSIILRNVISNAIKYTPNGGVINLTYSENLSGYAITIENSGARITDDKVAQILSKNYSSEPGTDGEKGLGLGLKLSQQFLTNLGGSLDIDNTRERTRFTVNLPKVTEHPPLEARN
jgi:signal transduction histidine kinase